MLPLKIFRTWSRFSVVTSVAMRFFRNAARSISKNELLKSIRQTISLGCSVLRGRAHNDVFEAAMFDWTFKKMTAEVPEIKLVKLLIIALTKKIHWWSDIVLFKHLLFIAEKQLHYNKNLTSLNYLVVVLRRKNKLMNFSFVFKLYFSSTLITYNSITNFYAAFSTPFRLVRWWCHAFLQERIQNNSTTTGKKNFVRSLQGTPRKMYFHPLKKTIEVE